MNSQSNILEKVFVKSGIPYRIIGGHRFYERREIRDMIAYLSVINNPSDEIRLRRIVNQPKRSIGDKTMLPPARLPGLWEKACWRFWGALMNLTVCAGLPSAEGIL